MCGFVGVFGRPGGRPVSEPWLRDLLGTIRHRGPDGEGEFVDGSRGIAACRLRIQGDHRGDQPIHSRDGRIVLVFNGEILRPGREALRRLVSVAGAEPPSEAAGDGPLIAEAIAALTSLPDGLDGSRLMPLLEGSMGAFAAWDRQEDVLWLARDRLGIKPLFVVETPDAVVFASEIRPLLDAVPGTRAADPDGLCELLHLHRPQRTLPFRGILSVAPGAVWRVRADGRVTRWTGSPGIRDLGDRGWRGDSLEDLDLALARATAAASEDGGVLFLSGGLDSGAVAAYGRGLHAITGRFSPHGGELDESALAGETARATGQTHEVVDLEDGDLIRDLPAVIRALEMPVAGPGALSLWRLAKRAAGHTRVVLTGTGGDELFAGYARAALVLGLRGRWTEGYEPLAARIDAAGDDMLARHRAAADRAGDLLPLLAPDFLASLPELDWPAHGVDASDIDPVERLVHVEVVTTLPMLFHVEDRVLMAHGLEGRPVLSLGDVPAVAAALPAWHRVGTDGEGKVALRRVLEGKLPDTVRLDRRKRGFPTPFARAARGAGREMVEDILTDRRFQERGWWNVDACRRLLDEERASYDRALYALLSWELWARTFLDGPSPATTQER